MASKRIETLSSLVKHNTVYDMCCDHGLIGEESLKYNREVIFIDIVKAITDSLSSRLLNEYSNFEIIAKSILDINEFKDNSTIILAGIGSRLLAEFLEMKKDLFNQSHQIIICSHSNQHLTLQAINNCKLTRSNESILEDQGRFYEIYDCIRLSDFKPNLGINKDFVRIKGSQYHAKQLEFFKFKQDDPYLKSIYNQLLNI